MWIFVPHRRYNPFWAWSKTETDWERRAREFRCNCGTLFSVPTIKQQGMEEAHNPLHYWNSEKTQPFKAPSAGPSLVAKWSRICLPMQDTGSIPDWGRSHMPWGNQAQLPQLLSLCSRARNRNSLSPCAATAEVLAPESPCSATREATAVRSPSIATREWPPLSATREKPFTAAKT